MNPTPPSFRLTHALVARLRGFDLGDDEAELERCAALEEEDELSPWGDCYYGVLLWRAGRFADAQVRFERSLERGESAAMTGLLAAVAQARAGEPEAGVARLEALLAEGAEDEDVTPLNLHVALANVARLAGQLDKAEAAFASAAALEERADIQAEWALLQLERGEVERAIASLESALVLDDGDHASAWELAATRATAGALEPALDALEKAVYWLDSYKERAREDERFAALRGQARFEALTAPPAPPDLGWLERFPALAALAHDPDAAALGLRFLGEAEAQEGGQKLLEEFTGNYTLGMLWNDALFAACGEAARGKLRVADTPSVWHRNGFDVTGGLYLDPAEPERLYFLPGPSVPPVFFHEVAPTVEALSALLGHYYPSRRVPRASLSQHARLFMGYSQQLQVVHPYSGSLVPIDFHELDRHLVFSPFLDSMQWGTAFDDDPWPDRIPPQPGYGIKIGNRSREMRRQAEGGNCRFTRRSLFSRAQVGYELHGPNLWVWDIRYNPNPFPELIERLNALLGFRMPTDLPFDVAGALLGFDFMRAEDLEEGLAQAAEPGQVAAYLDVIAALRHSDPELLPLVRRYLRHEDSDLRASLANLCLRYDWLGLLEDMAVLEPDPGLAEQMLRVVIEGIAPPRFTDLGEPEGYWDAQGEDDYEEEEP
ncbi:MAG: hypothetical protein H6740_07975 [Alphaproteobacteria bacterium]|nr:hypothetical protein [Alphaproteobacteria bacterium]